MAKQDYYDLLGINKSATSKEIKTAFRSKAKQYHPDINKDPGAEKEFKKYAEAYEVLSDSDKKSQYDQFGQAGIQAGFGGGGFDSNNFDFGDIFGDIFGGAFGGGGRRRQQQGPQRGQDLFLRMNIEFMTAVFGEDIEVSIQSEDMCKKCDGKRAASPSDVQTCTVCSGSGVEQVQQRTPFGVIATQRTCSVCGGEGIEITKECNGCAGVGHTSGPKDINLKIPAGIQDSQQLRITGKGKAGIKGGPNGDLYVEITVKEHDKFYRRGQDIFIDIPLSFIDATLGIELDIPTVHGFVEMKVPAGTTNGKKLRLANKGIKTSNGQTGHQFVVVNLETPKSLTRKQKEILKDFKSTEKESVFDKFKKMF